MQKIREAWKAVVALLVPIAFAAASEMIGAVSEWVENSGSMWAGVIVGLLSSVAVYLKANAPAAE